LPKARKAAALKYLLTEFQKEIVDFRGSQGSMRAPEYGHSLTFDKLSNGSHTLELRNIKGSVMWTASH
jgi:hypothetical protein